MELFYFAIYQFAYDAIRGRIIGAVPLLQVKKDALEWLAANGYTQDPQEYELDSPSTYVYRLHRNGVVEFLIHRIPMVADYQGTEFLHSERELRHDLG